MNKVKTNDGFGNIPAWAQGLQAAELGRVVRMREACLMLGVARTTLWRLVEAGRLPAPLQIGARSRGFTVATLLEAQSRMQPAAARRGGA